MDLTGEKNALVTGTSRGIGKAIAMKLAGQGANIAIPYLGDPAEAEQTQKEIQALGVKCAMYVCDVSSFEASREVVEKDHRGIRRYRYFGQQRRYCPG